MDEKFSTTPEQAKVLKDLVEGRKVTRIVLDMMKSLTFFGTYLKKRSCYHG